MPRATIRWRPGTSGRRPDTPQPARRVGRPAARAQEATRDYVVEADGAPENAVLLNIFGGKITTYRRLSENILEKIEEALGSRGRPWTAGASLPGGDFPARGYDEQVARLLGQYPFLGRAEAGRLVRLYGTRAWTILGEAKAQADLGETFGAGLTQAEICYLMKHEWALTAEDVLWRRTKLGLYFDSQQTSTLQSYVQALTTDRSPARQSIRHGSAS
jgi:glycerol-3-phosphate dehydrogenase